MTEPPPPPRSPNCAPHDVTHAAINIAQTAPQSPMQARRWRRQHGDGGDDDGGVGTVVATMGSAVVVAVAALGWRRGVARWWQRLWRRGR